MTLIVVITHASFDESRRLALHRLLSQLRIEAPDIPWRVAEDSHRRGSLWCWRRAMEQGLFSDATHIVWLPDDAIVCRDFGRILRACIAARPDDVFDCFVNHPLLRASKLNVPWYTTSDGYVGMGGCMPRALLEEHLAWRDARPELADYPNDAGVNLWAADTGRLIYKTAWTLVQHDESLHSLDGHDDQAANGHVRSGLRWLDDERAGVTEDVMNFLGRSYLAPKEHMGHFASTAAPLGMSYRSNVYDLVRRLEPAHWNVDAMYQAVEPTPGIERVVIVVPRYHEDSEIVETTEPSREAASAALEAAGIECVVLKPPPESHVDRMRQCATHAALKAGATRILWWDADIECLTPALVVTMVKSGHGIIAGACPFKDQTGRVVCNLLPETIEALSEGGSIDLEGGCLEVQDAGSGFMMVSRDAIVRMMHAHPELLHLSRRPGMMGEPLWALWDATLAGKEHDGWAETVRARSFDTEDWHFCRLWQEMGERVYVLVPMRFRHYGIHGYEASFEQQWGLERA